MTDRFSSAIAIPLGSDAEFWAIARAVWAVAERLFRANAAAEPFQQARAWGPDGTFVNDTLAELERAVLHNRTSIGALSLGISIPGRLNPPIDFYALSFVNEALTVDVVGFDRLAVQRTSRELASRLNRSKRLMTILGKPIDLRPGEIRISSTQDNSSLARRQAELAALTAEAEQRVRDLDTRHTAPPAIAMTAPVLPTRPQRLAESPSESRETTGQWWTRTWRDHTAATVVAIVAGLIVGVFIVLLGINYLPSIVPIGPMPTRLP